MSKLDQLKNLLQSKGLWAKKSLGQNFLVDQAALDAIVAAADLSKQDRVVEVGPGTGFLTEQLVQKAGSVTSVEVDFDMVQILREQFKLSKNLMIVHGDILQIPVDRLPFIWTEAEESSRSTARSKPYKVVANIPYYITSPVIKHFLQAEQKPELIVLLVQKEVAQKICSLKGRSFITMETEIYGKPEYISTIPAKSFYPSPKVDSAILRIIPHAKGLVPESKMRDFLRLVKFGYTQKRKKLSNALAAGLRKESSEMAELLGKAKIDPNLRAEDLEIKDWKRLMTVLHSVD